MDTCSLGFSAALSNPLFNLLYDKRSFRYIDDNFLNLNVLDWLSDLPRFSGEEYRGSVASDFCISGHDWEGHSPENSYRPHFLESQSG